LVRDLRQTIYPISRLAVLAESASAEYAAAFINAQRSQIFAALYRRQCPSWQTIIQESVIRPLDFFASSMESARKSSLTWVSLDPEILSSTPFWHRTCRKLLFVTVRPPLAAALGMLALRNPAAVDALTLDANYVRRTDAEIFGKQAALMTGQILPQMFAPWPQRIFPKFSCWLDLPRSGAMDSQ